MTYDAIVLGLGGMGSAVVRQLADRGARVVGLDRYTPPHAFGSTHGRSRIIRMAYMEDPAYVPLLRRAYELWGELAASTQEPVFLETGGMMIGPPGCNAVAGTLASARAHGLRCQQLDAETIRERFPAFTPPDHHVGVYEEVAGVVFPEHAIAVQLAAAAAAGAELRFEVVADRWAASPTAVRVDVGNQRLEAGALIITAGAWLPELGIPGSGRLRVARQVMHWFEPPGGIAPFLPGAFPIYMWESESAPFFYGFPALDGTAGGVKAAIHHGGEVTTAATVDRTVHDSDRAAMQACLEGRIPALGNRIAESTVCMYTNTPDHDFLLGPVPGHANVFVAGGLSGHGFKFATVVGEILADLATEGATPLPIGPFAPARLAR